MLTDKEMEVTFDNALYKLFPDATRFQYWGAAIHLDNEFNVVAVTCGGITKYVGKDHESL